MILPEIDEIFFEDIARIEMDKLLKISEEMKKKEGNRKMNKNDEFVIFKNENGGCNFYVDQITKGNIYHDKNIDEAIKFDNIELARLMVGYLSRRENAEYKILKRVCTFEEVE